MAGTPESVFQQVLLGREVKAAQRSALKTRQPPDYFA